MKWWGWLLIGLGVLSCGGGVVALNQARAFAGRPATPEGVHTVARGEIRVEVVESGTINAVRTAEVKSRAQGRLAELLRDEGDLVQEGDLIARIDPQETRLVVEQNRAQLRAAQSGIARQSIEIDQRRRLVREQLVRARARLEQLELELGAAPVRSRAQIDSAEAALRAARDQREQLVRVTQPNEEVDVESELAQAEATLANAETELGRLESLLSQDFAARREVDNQRLQVDLARSRLAAVRERRNRLGAQQLKERQQADARVAQAEASLREARLAPTLDRARREELVQQRAAVREAEVQLRDVEALQASRAQSSAQADQIRSSLSDSERQLRETEIRAPFSGVITRRFVQVGELVASLSSFSAGTSIVRLEDRSSMVLKLNINEIDMAKLALGMPAGVEVDAIPGTSFSGRVTKIAPARSDAAAGGGDPVVRYEVEVRIEGTDRALRTGMTARARIKVATRKEAVIVPIDYVAREGNRRFVYLLPPDSRSEKTGTKTEIQVGLETGSTVEIRSGVAPGAKLVRPPFAGPPREGAF